MRTLSLISLLSAAVVVTAAPNITDISVPLTVCTASNAGTNCATIANTWGDSVCASIIVRNNTLAATSTALYNTTQCIPRVVFQYFGPNPIGQYNFTVTSQGNVAGTAQNRTNCNTETDCGVDACCVRTITTFNGASSNNTLGFCGVLNDFILGGDNAVIGTSGTGNSFSATMHCYREINPLRYAAAWDNANFFAFSMAVIFGLLALFAY